MDLNERSLLALVERFEPEPLAVSPRLLVITEEGLAYARDLAARDPEFARRVREEFPDLADSLIGPV
jgi:hypothetical protein